MKQTCHGLTSQGAAAPAGFQCIAIDDGLAVVVSLSPMALDRQAFAEAAQRLAAGLDPFLPFGYQGGALEQVRDAVRKDCTAWHGALDGLTGCGEVIATVTSTCSGTPASATNSPNASNWLRARANGVKAARSAALAAKERLEEALATASIPLRCSRAVQIVNGADIALLIPHPHVGTAIATLRQVVLPVGALTVTGPWPCFSFGPSQTPAGC